jgi:hypothetical protein
MQQLRSPTTHLLRLEPRVLLHVCRRRGWRGRVALSLLLLHRRCCCCHHVSLEHCNLLCLLLQLLLGGLLAREEAMQERSEAADLHGGNDRHRARLQQAAEVY